ncbi:hypothetical protein niasHT_038437 [Heterodera trifolii]|uniref:Uncharacterized protein n=1 Tax=Heterodera trifolii TaxID=157864 RepID=A0ABD2IRJ8_9BILA
MLNAQKKFAIFVFLFEFSCNFLTANNVNKVGDGKQQQQQNAYVTAPIGGRQRAYGSVIQQQTLNSSISAANDNKQIFIGVPTPPPVPRVPVPYGYGSKSFSQNDNGTSNSKQIFIGVPTPPPVATDSVRLR